MSVLGEAVIEIGADGSGFRRQLERELRRSRVDSSGEGAGRDFGDGFTRGVDKSFRGGGLRKTFFKMGAWATGLLSLIAPIGPALVGIVAGLSALIGAVGLASGSLVTLAAAVSSLGLAAVATKVAFSGMGDAMKAQSKAQQELAETGAVSAATQKQLDAAMKNLAPSGRAVVKELVAQRSAWGALRKSVQQGFFSGVAEDIKSVSKTLLPVLNRTLGDTASILNGAVRGFASWVNSASGIATITSILDGMNAALKSILPGLGAIARGMATLWAGSLPQAAKMSETFLSLGERFEAWASRISESGKLAGFLADASSAASSLLGAIGSLGGLLKTVFGAGADEGVSMLDTFSAATDRLNEFFKTAEGSSALDSFYSTIQATAQTAAALGATLGPIFSGLGKVLDELSPGIDAFRAALLPVASALSEQIGAALTKLAPKVGEIADEFKQLLPILMPIVKFFGGLFISSVAGAVNGVLNVIKGVLTTINGVVKTFKAVLSGDWSAAWNGVKQIVSGVFTTILGAIQTFLYAGVLGVFRAGFTAVKTFVTSFWSAFKSMFTGNLAAIRTVVTNAWAGIKAVFTGALNGIKNGMVAIYAGIRGATLRMMSSVRSAISGGWNGVLAFIRSIPGKIRGVAGRFLSAGKELGANVIKGLASGLKKTGGFLSDIGNAIRKKINSILHLPKTLGKGPLKFTIPAFATGTLSAPGGMALVGERGPELVGMPRGSRVYPAHTTERILGSANNGPTDLSEDTLNRLAALVANMILLGAGKVVEKNNLSQSRAVYG